VGPRKYSHHLLQIHAGNMGCNPRCSHLIVTLVQWLMLSSLCYVRVFSYLLQFFSISVWRGRERENMGCESVTTKCLQLCVALKREIDLDTLKMNHE
jgi:hypothetical protein